MNIQMQAKLNLSEFSYLLHTLDAEWVVGIHNESVFPSDEAARDALLAQGFEDLQKDGWLIPQNGVFQTNANLMLLAAVVAAPEFTIMLTRRIEGEKRQTVTYYQSQGIFVEQIYTDEEKFLLTQLASMNDILDRLILAVEIPEQSTLETAVSLNVSAFEKAMEDAKAGNSSSLTQLLETSGLTKAVADQVADHISQLNATGNIEIAAFAGDQLQILTNIVVLKNGMDTWTISPSIQPETVHLQTVNRASFAHMIQTILNN